MFALSPPTTFLYLSRIHCKPNVTVFCYRLSCIKYICRYMLIYRYLFCAWFVLEYVNPKRVPPDDSNQCYGLMKKCCIITHLCMNFNRLLRNSCISWLVYQYSKKKTPPSMSFTRRSIFNSYNSYLW